MMTIIEDYSIYSSSFNQKDISKNLNIVTNCLLLIVIEE